MPSHAPAQLLLMVSAPQTKEWMMQSRLFWAPETKALQVHRRGFHRALALEPTQFALVLLLMAAGYVCRGSKEPHVSSHLRNSGLAADAPAPGRSARLGSTADVRECVAGGQGLRGNSGHAAICHAGAPHRHHSACAAACQGHQVSASRSQNEMSCMLDQIAVPVSAALLLPN